VLKYNKMPPFVRTEPTFCMALSQHNLASKFYVQEKILLYQVWIVRSDALDIGAFVRSNRH